MTTEPALPARFTAAAEYKTPLFVAAGLALGLAAGALVAYNTLPVAPLVPFGLFFLLAAIALFTAAWVVGLRREIALEHDPSADDEVAKPFEARRELQRFGRVGVAVIFCLGAFSVLGLATMVLGGSRPELDRIAEATSLFVGGGIGLLLAFPLLVFGRAAARIAPDRLPEGTGVAGWLTAGQWVSILTALGLIAEGFRVEVVPVGEWLGFALLVFVAVLAVEMVVRAFDRFLRPPMDADVVTAPIALLPLVAFFAGHTPLAGLMDVVEQRLGVTIRSAWAIQFIRRALLPAALLVAAVIWLSTGLVMIRPDEEGVRLRFGRLASEHPVPPGLALKLPWPLESIDRVATKRARTFGVGYSGQRKESLLWTQAHSGEEFTMLLGDGSELISVDATVTYRIADAIAFSLKHASPETELEGIAYRLLTSILVRSDLATLLRTDREKFSADYTARLEAACAERGLGLEIQHTSFASLHPPVRVADPYQRVVSEQIAARTRVIEAEGDRLARLPSAEADVYAEEQSARADAVTWTSGATNAVAVFAAELDAHRAAPVLYRFRRRLEAIGEAAIDATVWLVDEEILRTGKNWLTFGAGAVLGGGR